MQNVDNIYSVLSHFPEEKDFETYEVLLFEVFFFFHQKQISNEKTRIFSTFVGIEFPANNMAVPAGNLSAFILIPSPGIPARTVIIFTM